MFSFLILASSTNENDCNIPPSKGADIKIKGLYFDSMTLLT